jgi:ornithine decarboxylase
VKCNPEPQFLNALYDGGVNFDCASERELLEIQRLARGTLPSRVVYANPCKSNRDLRAAREMGAPTTVVDSVEELEKLEGYSGGALVRIAVDDTASNMPFSTKFGAQLEKVEAIAAAGREKRLKLCGVSFHVGSGCSSGDAYSGAILRAYESLLTLRRMGHTDAKVLDIGGGFLPDEKDFRNKALLIRGAMMNTNALEEDAGRKPLEWIAEPGRFFAANSFDFFVRVIGKKKAASGFHYTVDDSLYGQFSSILFDHARPSWVRVRMGAFEKGRQRSPGVLFGRTCDSVDVIARAAGMEELEVGDWLWFPRMGAYTRATASEFNGFPTPSVFVDGGLPSSDLRNSEFVYSAPKDVEYMPSVSAKAFWNGPGVKN